MEKKFQLLLFGKKGCEKCTVLNQRLDALLETDQWQDFEKRYCDVLSEDGLVEFSRLECLNPQRIPAVVVLERQSDQLRPLVVPNPEEPMPEFGSSRLYQYLGLQTDYSAQGVIRPAMLTALLARARELAA